ncbi:hypothetical protein QJS10_CPA05g01897 [Acorus calamus]|uniref:DNA-directed DNA polymerase n=1 Tax=Acorus calamus TaxID=4465 RepID=A0AAV9ETS3_ACOCL|nr:hypothetical protein QJS10_CPA05g01897 [Acorus calamus]
METKAGANGCYSGGSLDEEGGTNESGQTSREIHSDAEDRKHTDDKSSHDAKTRTSSNNLNDAGELKTVDDPKTADFISSIYNPPDLNRNITEIFGRLINIYRGTTSALGDDRRSFSYYKAIPVIEKLPFKIESVDQVRHLPTIGKSLKDHINEIITTGKLSKLEHFETDEKVRTVSLFGEVWGIGPATALKLYEKGHRTLDDLKNEESLSHSQKLGLKYFDDIKKRILRHEVKDMEALLQKVGQDILPGVIVVCGGSFRRGKSSCGDMDIIITHPDGKSHKGFLPRYVKYLKDMKFLREDLVFSIHSTEGTDSGVDTYFGLCTYPGQEQRHRIDLKVYPRDIYAFGLVAWTGNDVLNRRSLPENLEKSRVQINLAVLLCVVDAPGAKSSISLTCKTEREVFNELGFPWLEPHERNLKNPKEEEISKKPKNDDKIRSSLSLLPPTHKHSPPPLHNLTTLSFPTKPSFNRTPTRFTPPHSSTKRRGGAGAPSVERKFDYDDEFDDGFDGSDGGDEPFEDMKRWFKDKPVGFGEGKVYDTSIEERLLEEIEKSRRVQLANLEKLKNEELVVNKQKLKEKKEIEDIPIGVRVRIGNLPKKKNIHRDLQLSFKEFPGILKISPAVSGNMKTRDPVCKGYAFVDLTYSKQCINFGKIQKKISCAITNPQDSLRSLSDKSSSNNQPGISRLHLLNEKDSGNVSNKDNPTSDYKEVAPTRESSSTAEDSSNEEPSIVVDGICHQPILVDKEGEKERKYEDFDTNSIDDDQVGAEDSSLKSEKNTTIQRKQESKKRKRKSVKASILKVPGSATR